MNKEEEQDLALRIVELEDFIQEWEQNKDAKVVLSLEIGKGNITRVTEYDFPFSRFFCAARLVQMKKALERSRLMDKIKEGGG